MRNNVNRIVNCETANLSKTVNAAVRQVENIKLIQQKMGINQLPQNLQQIALLRVENEDLTLKEFKILKSLIQNYPQVVTREKLLDSIWGYDYFGDTRIVDAHIKNIRKKIKLPYIKTVKGIGYTLKKDI